MTKIISWDIYEISTTFSNIKDVMLRGRIRKFCLEKGINVLVENASDEENKVRFAIFNGTDSSLIVEKIKEMIPDSNINLIKENVQNPVLSKLKVNIEERYTL